MFWKILWQNGFCTERWEETGEAPSQFLIWPKNSFFLIKKITFAVPFNLLFSFFLQHWGGRQKSSSLEMSFGEFWRYQRRCFNFCKIVAAEKGVFVLGARLVGWGAGGGVVRHIGWQPLKPNPSPCLASPRAQCSASAQPDRTQR